jgi:hypothetical protein
MLRETCAKVQDVITCVSLRVISPHVALPTMTSLQAYTVVKENVALRMIYHTAEHEKNVTRQAALQNGSTCSQVGSCRII